LTSVVFSQTGPGGVSSNLELWLKADAGLTKLVDDVTAWTDQSGNGNSPTTSGTIKSNTTQRLIITPPEQPVIRNHEHKTWIIVNFYAINDKQTKVELNHLGWLDGKKWDVAYHYFDSAWEVVLTWLEKSCEKEK